MQVKTSKQLRTVCLFGKQGDDLCGHYVCANNKVSAYPRLLLFRHQRQTQNGKVTTTHQATAHCTDKFKTTHRAKKLPFKLSRPDNP